MNKKCHEKEKELKGLQLECRGPTRRISSFIIVALLYCMSAGNIVLH